MAIDISSIVRKHLSGNADPIKEATSVIEDEVTDVAEGISVDFSEVTEVTEGISVDFSEVIENTGTVIESEAQKDENQDWFMSESEQDSVAGALLASVITNVVNV